MADRMGRQLGSNDSKTDVIHPPKTFLLTGSKGRAAEVDRRFPYVRFLVCVEHVLRNTSELLADFESESVAGLDWNQWLSVAYAPRRGDQVGSRKYSYFAANQSTPNAFAAKKPEITKRRIKSRERGWIVSSLLFRCV